jgi:hypothetical protein
VNSSSFKNNNQQQQENNMPRTPEQRSEAARRAVATHRARKLFLNKYGQRSYDILKLFVSRYPDLSPTDIAAQLRGVSQGTAAATVANYRRDGVFGDMVEDCKFHNLR